jgi:hypothetical protein
MDPERRTKIVKISGLVVLAFAVYALLSSFSYLFTWKADRSLLGDPDWLNRDLDVHNAAGKAGAGLGHLMICRWFGLGSFALVIAFFILALRMLLGRRSFSVVKAVILAISAAFISSFVLSFFSRLFNINTLFGGGLGGECGSLVIAWSENLFGRILTFFLLVIMLVAWSVFVSKRFSNWFMNIGKGAGGKEEEVSEEDVANDEAATSRKSFNWLAKAEAKEEEPEAGVVESAAEKAAGPAEAIASSDTVSAPESGTESEEATDADKLEVVAGEDLSTDVTKELPRIDVRDDLKNFRFPPLNLLEDYENSRQEVSPEELKRNNYKIRATLKTYKIDVDNVKAVVGPTVTLYKVYPAPGVKISSIKNLQDDIAMALHAKGVRVVTLADSVGIEVANDKPSMVPLKAMLNDDAFRESKAELPVAIGYTITQKVKVFDLADAPHLLVAGATKQGKSVGLNVLISSLLYSKHPSELKFVFVDPKMVEFTAYSRLLNHYLAVMPGASEADETANSIAKSPKQAEIMLKALCVEMDARYELLSTAMVNNIKLYNEKYKDRHLRPDQGHKYLPYIVVVVDEYADLTMSVGASNESKATARSISTSVIRLAQKGRAAGIHVVLATQRPSVDVITGLIKSNFPTRIAFRVFSMTDSRTILDSPGAEKLIGKGDMIYYAGVDMERVQCAYISGSEINDVTKFISEQKGYKKSYNTPYYLPEPEPDKTEDGVAMIDMRNLDERFEEAAKQVVMSQRGSTSDLQRKLGMGYAKAGRVMDQLEAAGIVGPQEGSKPRQVLVDDLAELSKIIDAYKNGFNE